VTVPRELLMKRNFKKSQENERGRVQHIWIMLKETYLSKSNIFLRGGGHSMSHMITYVQQCRVSSANKNSRRYFFSIIRSTI
jgi:hypothetical protein